MLELKIIIETFAARLGEIISINDFCCSYSYFVPWVYTTNS